MINSCPMCGTDILMNPEIKRVNGWSVNQCITCGGDYATPISFKRSDDALPFYDARDYKVGQWLSWAHRDFLKYAPAGQSLLDIGAGTGDFLNKVIKLGYNNVIGIEMDPRAVAAGNTHWKFNKLITGDAMEYISSSNQSWDIITMFAVLEHVQDPNELFSEVLIHLKPSGYVAICLQNEGNLYAWLWSMLSPGNDWPPNHYTRWTKKSLEMFLERHGMAVVFRSTSKPGLIDNFTDLIAGIKNRRLNFIVTNIYVVMEFIMRPLDWMLGKLSKEGRAQLVIAKRIVK